MGLLSVYCPSHLCSIHLGITDTSLDTVWRTQDGVIAPRTNWHPSQPNGLTGDPIDCARRNPSDAEWFDENCETPYEYYCEGNY